MSEVEEMVIEIGTIGSGTKVVLYQKVTQHVSLVQTSPGTDKIVLSLKEVRQLRRLLGQAEGKMRKLFERMAKERRRASKQTST